MSAKISITPEQMRTRIGEVDRAKQDYISVIQNMDSMMGQLQTEWHGKASQGFAEQFDRLKAQSFEPMRNLFEDMGKQMKDTLDVIEQLDAQIAGKFSG